MHDCPYNAGVLAATCKGCPENCGFDPKEIGRRKNKINKGEGLTTDRNGLRHLKIERRK